jgi:hypothetical protein
MQNNTIFLFVCLFVCLQLAAHPDQNVKNGAELLDRLIKVGLTLSL